MRLFLVLTLFGGAYSAYVFDLMIPALDAGEVNSLMANRATAQWPTYDSVPADVTFDCASKPQPGFYADPQFQCQVFHRCDINGNLTSYLCVNTTVFNQLTLTCDYFYNVDCSRFTQFENFGNSRLYTNQDLFDSPPADYVLLNTKGEGTLAPTLKTTRKRLGPSQTTAKKVAVSATTKASTEAPLESTQAPELESTQAPEVESTPVAELESTPQPETESTAATEVTSTVTTGSRATTKKGPIRVGGSVSINLSARNGEDKSGSAVAVESASNV